MTRSSRPASRDPIARIVDWGLQVRWNEFPEEVRETARRIAADCVGCALGGLDSRKGNAALSWAARSPGRKGVSVPGTAARPAPAPAAFAWGELVNALEFDPDLTPCHVSPFVLPAPWVTAEEHGRSGRELAEALVVGHEVAAQIAGRMPGLREVGGSERRPRYRFRGRWSAYTAGIVGSVVAAARLRGDSAGKTVSALGIAAGLAPVPLSSRFFFTERPSDLKYGSPGWVNFAAMAALDLSDAGYLGDGGALLGDNGLLSILGNGAVDVEGAAQGLGRRWRILDTVFKRFPTGGVGHVGLDLFEQYLAETGASPEQIESIEVTSDPIVEVPVLANRTVRDPLDAQFALAWGFALLPFYPPGPAWQSPRAFRDPRVRQLFAKVRVRADPAVVRDLYQQLVVERLPYVRRRPTRLRVRASGRLWERSDSIAEGYPERPVSLDGLREKFHRNAVGHLPHATSDRLFSRVYQIDRERSLRQISRVLRGATRGSGGRVG